MEDGSIGRVPVVAEPLVLTVSWPVRRRILAVSGGTVGASLPS